MRWSDIRFGMRQRIAVSLALLGILAVLAQALVFLAIVDDKEEDFIEDLLNQQIDYSLQRWLLDPATAQPNTPDLQLHILPDGPGERVPAVLRTLPVGNHELILGRRELHVAVRDAHGRRFILTYDVEDHEARWRNILLLVSGGLLVFSVLIVGVGYLLARRMANGLERLARRVGDDGALVLAEPGMSPELQRLAEALDHYRLRQADRVAREQAFAANLSHELRTPLTAIRTDAELLSLLPDLPDGVGRRALRIVASVDRINALASGLLMLARDMRPGPPERIAVLPAIRQQWELLASEPSLPGVLECEISPGCEVWADPVLLDLVLRNLLDNARRHGAGGAVCCTLVGTCLRVRDAGAGFAEGELATVFERFYSARPGGVGLGLALVRHACTACGWQVGAANDPAGGGVVWVDFGDALHISPGD